MNSLEWINKQILFVKQNIQYHKDLLAESEEEYANEIISAIKLLEPGLQTLQQIKAELEAWEVVQGTIVEGQDGDGHYCYIETVYFTGEEGEKIKKGLYNDETR